MALKVVPAGDERCDIHNGRSPASYVCETCLVKFGIDPEQAATRRRSRRQRARLAIGRIFAGGNRRIRVGLGVLLVIAVVAAAVVLLAGRGGGSGTPSQDDVVKALDLVPNTGRPGWITADGTCSVVTIVTGADVHPGNVAGNLAVEVTNESRTVGAVVTPNVNSFFSASIAACVDQVGGELKSNF
jgi:hypothetical protein